MEYFKSSSFQFTYILPPQQAPTYQSLYPGVDNRYLAATDYFAAAGYRSLGTYYPEYAAHAALGNSYLDVSGESWWKRFLD